MKFSDWLDAERGRTKEVARLFGVTPSSVSQWRGGVPLAHMKAVRRISGGLVQLDDLVPDERGDPATTEEVSNGA
jgi:DNA-binding transcriptional regulator YdaS (Cro superfamily)